MRSPALSPPPHSMLKSCDPRCGGTAAVLSIRERPLFIIGPGRGGTTHLQRLLLADPRFCGGQESHFFQAFAPVLEQFDRKLGAERPHGLGCYWRRDTLRGVLRDIWRQTFAECIDASPGATVLVEKTPAHAMYVPGILELLPEARFLHIVRDSRAVAASLIAAYRAGWGRGWAAGTARGAADQWNRSIKAALDDCRVLPRKQYHRVRYEELVEDSAVVLAGIYQWLGIECREKTDSPEGECDGGELWYGGELAERRPAEPKGFVRKRGIDGWRRELGWWDREIVWWLTKDLMRELGYRRDGSLVEPAGDLVGGESVNR